MINLLPKKTDSNEGLSKYQRPVYLLTHLGLIFYVLFIVATIAVMLRGNERQKQLSSEITSLESQLKTYSNVEALVLHIDRTQENIDKFNKSRQKLADFVQNFNIRPASVSIKNWDFRTGGISRISVESQDQKDLEEYTNLLRLKFSGLQLEQSVTKGGAWNSILTLK
jgi:hypothetical protein